LRPLDGLKNIEGDPLIKTKKDDEDKHPSI
jgi:hypothetical protein